MLRLESSALQSDEPRPCRLMLQVPACLAVHRVLCCPMIAWNMGPARAMLTPSFNTGHTHEVTPLFEGACEVLEKQLNNKKVGQTLAPFPVALSSAFLRVRFERCSCSHW